MSPSITEWRTGLSEHKTRLCAFHRSAVDKADELYSQVDELLHQLALKSNQRIRALELLQALEAQEDVLRQVEATVQTASRLLLVSAIAPAIAAAFVCLRLCPPRLKCGYRRWAGQEWRNQGSPCSTRCSRLKALFKSWTWLPRSVCYLLILQGLGHLARG